jgi:hypothetical protein
MECPHCNSDAPDGSAFCNSCGSQLNDEPDNSRLNYLRPLVLLLCASVLVLAVIFYARSVGKGTVSPPSPPTAYPIVRSSAIRSTPLLREIYTVAPRSRTSALFVLPGPCHVAGMFRAQGGRGNDIRVIIVDGMGLENLNNHNQFRAYYDSGKVTVANIDVQLGPGTFYMVFDNSFSLLTNKLVTLSLNGSCQ